MGYLDDIINAVTGSLGVPAQGPYGPATPAAPTSSNLIGRPSPTPFDPNSLKGWGNAAVPVNGAGASAPKKPAPAPANGDAASHYPAADTGETSFAPPSGKMGRAEAIDYAAMPPGGFPWAPNSFYGSLSATESGMRNIFSTTDKDYAGRPGSRSQGYFQIDTPTAEQYAKAAGIDLAGRGAMQLSPQEQMQLVSVIPFKRFGPRTQQLLQQKYGPIDPNSTIGELAVKFDQGGGGDPPDSPQYKLDDLPAAPGGASAAQAGSEDPNLKAILDFMGARFPNQQAYAQAHPWLNAITQTLGNPLTQAAMGYLGQSLAAPKHTSALGRLGLGLQGGLKGFNEAEQLGYKTGGELGGGGLGGMGGTPEQQLAMLKGITDLATLPGSLAKTQADIASEQAGTAKTTAETPHPDPIGARTLLSYANSKTINPQLAQMAAGLANEVNAGNTTMGAAMQQLRQASQDIAAGQKQQEETEEGPVKLDKLKADAQEAWRRARGEDPANQITHTYTNPDDPSQSVDYPGKKDEPFKRPDDVPANWIEAKPEEVLRNKDKGGAVAAGRPVTTGGRIQSSMINGWTIITGGKPTGLGSLEFWKAPTSTLVDPNGAQYELSPAEIQKIAQTTNAGRNANIPGYPGVVVPAATPEQRRIRAAAIGLTAGAGSPTGAPSAPSPTASTNKGISADDFAPGSP